MANPNNGQSRTRRGGFSDLRRDRPGLVLAIILVSFAISTIIALAALHQSPEEKENALLLINTLGTIKP